MPLPKDERIVALANDILTQFDQIFGIHSGFRAAHAKGLLLTGTFTPAAEAQSLTKPPGICCSVKPKFNFYQVISAVCYKYISLKTWITIIIRSQVNLINYPVIHRHSFF